MTLTAMVLSVPPYVRSPQLAKGESLFRYVAARYPQEYAKLKERLKRDFSVSDLFLDSIDHEMNVEDKTLQSALVAFISHRLPTYSRTVLGLCRLRKTLEGSDIPIVQVIAGFTDKIELTVFKDLGVEIVTNESYGWKALPRVKGELLWLVAGGTRLTPVALSDVGQIFEQVPGLALYHDKAYSFVYRTSSLRSLVKNGIQLSDDMRTVAETLYDNGHQVLIDPSESPLALSTLEPFYGS